MQEVLKKKKVAVSLTVRPVRCNSALLSTNMISDQIRYNTLNALNVQAFINSLFPFIKLLKHSYEYAAETKTRCFKIPEVQNTCIDMIAGKK